LLFLFFIQIANPRLGFLELRSRTNAGKSKTEEGEEDEKGKEIRSYGNYEEGEEADFQKNCQEGIG
jgi:hypothetical protein